MIVKPTQNFDILNNMPRNLVAVPILVSVINCQQTMRVLENHMAHLNMQWINVMKINMLYPT